MSQTSIIYLDVAAVAIMLVSLASILLRGLTKGPTNRVFLAVMIVVTIAAISALFGEFFDDYIGPAIAQGNQIETEAARIVRTGLAMLYYIMRSLTVPAYLVLIAAVSDTAHKLTDSVLVRLILWVPMTLVVLLILTNPIHHQVFYFADGVLNRGPALQLVYAEAIYYSVEGIIWILWWRKLFSANEFATLFFLYPIMLAVTFIQYNIPGLRIEMFVTSIALMLVSAFVIHPETRRDADVDAASFSAYREMLQRAFATGKPLCLVYLEIVNMERFRQLVGKMELQTIARAVADNLSRRLERDDVLYYLHNGVFCISPRNIDPEHALTIAWKTHEEGKERSRSQEERAMVAEMRSCIVRVPEDVSDMETMKSFGRRFSHLAPTSCVTTFAELSRRDDFKLQMALSSIIADAISNRSFEVHYQPIYCVSDGCFHTAEALVRLNDPQFGWVPPALFIPEAEQNGLIIDIGSILIEKVCAFLGKVDFEATGLNYVEANLSVDQCARPELADEVLGFMKQFDVKPSRLNLEITETSAVYSQEVIEANVRALAEAGIALSIDDYGTGYSNMTRMLAMPFSLVKIDQSFVAALDDDVVSSVLADTVAMLKSVGFKVLIEGVETREQAEKLIAMNVDYIQGYLYSLPLPENEFLAFLDRHNA